MKQFFYRITMIRVLPASPKNGVNHITTPVHLQGMEPLVLLVSRLNTMAFLGIIIVKNNRVDTEFNHTPMGLPEHPNKKPLKKLSKNIDSQKRKPIKKSFHRVRRNQMLFNGCEQCGITLIMFEVIEPTKVTAVVVHEITE